MATKDIDDVLVELLKTCQPKRIQDRVYHIEQYQNLDTLGYSTGIGVYPCIVYELIEDTPSLELAGDNGFGWATYSVTILAQNSADLRPTAKQLLVMNESKFNVDLNTQYTNIEWITVTSEIESQFAAAEQQEKGLKVSTSTVMFHHWRIA